MTMMAFFVSLRVTSWLHGFITCSKHSGCYLSDTDNLRGHVLPSVRS